MCFCGYGCECDGPNPSGQAYLRRETEKWQAEEARKREQPGSSAANNTIHHGPKDSRDTCAACLFDAGVQYLAPGTPTGGKSVSTLFRGHGAQGCQGCYQDINGVLRCGGCWIGPWPSAASR